MRLVNKQTKLAVVPGQVDLFFCVLSVAMFGMVTRLILDDGNTFTIATLLMTVLRNHVQLSNAILNTHTQKWHSYKHQGYQIRFANIFHYWKHILKIDYQMLVRATWPDYAIQWSKHSGAMCSRAWSAQEPGFKPQHGGSPTKKLFLVIAMHMINKEVISDRKKRVRRCS